MGFTRTITLLCTITALLAQVSTAARAEVLPLLLGISDPWNSQKKIADYGKKLKPASCPGPITKGQKLAMNDVVIIVLCNNTATRADYLSLLSAADTYVSGYSAYLPTIDALAASKTYNTFYPGTSQNSYFSEVATSTPTINAGLVLYDFGQREATIDSAEKSLVSTGLTYESSLQGTIASALANYYAVLAAQRNVLIAFESHRVAKESYDAAALRYKLGLVPSVEELQASAGNSSALLGIEQAENGLSQARATLAIQMGLSPDADFEVVDTDDQALAVDPFNGKAKELMEIAKTKRVDLEASRKSLEAARIRQKATRRANRASITASVGMGFSDLDIANNSTERNQSIGVSVSIPIFNGFVNTYNERTLKRDIQTQQMQLEQAERDVEQDVFVAWQNYQTAKRSWEVNKEQLAVSTKLQEITAGRYKEGLATIIEVLTAQSTYIGALQSELDARYALLTSRLDLVRAVGVLNLDTMNPKESVDGNVPIPPTIPITTQPLLD